ncbi:hypothetical protein B0H34DRAFT_621600, partial [Crassisporium funariophilum]
LHIKTCSSHITNALTLHLNKWEDRGWIGTNNKDLWKAIIATMRDQANQTTIHQSDDQDHQDTLDNAKLLAKTGALMPKGVAEYLSIDNKFNISGARLINMTQALHYRGIMDTNQLKSSERTTAISELTGTSPSHDQIWKSIRNKDITPKIRNYMWKTLHNAHKVGPYWRNIPTLEHRANCHVCHTDETMHHILTECKASGQEIIWTLAKSL